MFPIAISPCPNDTYLFWGWVSGRVSSLSHVTAHYADIDILNHWASLRKFPLIKVSIANFASISNHYSLLPVGVALGYGVGPIIISKERKINLSQCRIAIPGKQTTAHLLFNLFFQAKEKVFCKYDEIFSLLQQDKVEAGLIIHESRFSFQNKGFYEIADLGALWERHFSLPLPLGGLALRNHVEDTDNICHILRDSLLLARQKHPSMYDFILSHSQEKDLSIVKKHIDLYVTDETFELSSQGKQAIAKMIQCAKDAHETSYFRNIR